MKEKFSWKIECAHTPETIDRILLPIRKRGLTLNSFIYNRVDDNKAECTFEVEVEPTEIERIHLNLVRIYDIDCVTRL